MNEIIPDRVNKIAQIISEVSHLNETDMFILLTLLADSTITNAELAKILKFKDGNSAAYHTRTMQQQGDIVVKETISGCVILKDVFHCFGDKTMAIIIGRATSDQDAAVYCKNYLVSIYPDIKVSLLINKYRTISDFFIDKPAIKKLKEMFQIGSVTSDVLKELQNSSV
ncbi:MAG: hypothetical protein O8C65_02525 [Candidatus Methanoperedens sp.]|nr:hypothetical protein [Candidatus Methanoperedens sp.]